MIRTRMTEMFGCRVPVMNGAMAGAAGGKLAASVAKGGGLPFIAAGHAQDSSIEALDAEVATYRELTKSLDPKAPLCIGFITYSSAPNINATLARLHPVDVVQFFAPAVLPDAENFKIARKNGVRLIIAQIGSLAEAQQALDAGADVIVAQGSEAGGHGLRTELGTPTLPLASAVLSLVSKRDSRTQVPVVLAAGGICDGRGLAAALALGCDGVVMGTRFLASEEAMGSTELKQAIVKATSDNTTRTRVFDMINNVTSATPWPCPFDSVGALNNSTCKAWDGKLGDLRETLEREGASGPQVSAYRQASQDPDVGMCLMGRGAGQIEAVEGAEEILRRVNTEAIETIRGLQSLLI